MRTRWASPALSLRLRLHPVCPCVCARSEYEEREIARLKDENPGLKLSQLKERAFASWQKSPENPKNQEGAVELS